MQPRRKILIIDDDEITLNLLESVLHGEGFEVFSTADGPRGMDICVRKKPDAILLDLALPGMGGLEVLRKIVQQNPNAKVVIVTGHASDESAEIALHAGAVAYIRKPVRPAELVERLNRLMVD